MDDLLDRVRREASALHEQDWPMCDTAALLDEAADALEAAREDAADAERYRWLRDEARTNRAPHIFQYPAQSFDHPQYPHFKDVGLDAAIEAAREARNG